MKKPMNNPIFLIIFSILMIISVILIIPLKIAKGICDGIDKLGRLFSRFIVRGML